MVLEIAGPGTIFGEIAVLSGSTRQADATCLTACRVLAIDKATFHHVLARTPEAMFAAIRLICERLSMTTARGIDIVSLPAPARLAKVLLHLVDLHAQHREDGVQMLFGSRVDQDAQKSVTSFTLACSAALHSAADAFDASASGASAPRPAEVRNERRRMYQDTPGRLKAALRHYVVSGSPSPT